MQWMLDGGFFMWPILLCLIIGLTISFERFYFITTAARNSRRVGEHVLNHLRDGGVAKALQACETEKGPVAAIYRAALQRVGRGRSLVEKSIVDAGGLEVAALERGLIWLSTIITMAPLLGFTGTVQGMIDSFHAIKVTNDMSPAIVAGGISIALLTTLFGLVVAMIIQVFHNYCIARIDRIVLEMEESAITLVDELMAQELLSPGDAERA